jgi:hypothetical protein
MQQAVLSNFTLMAQITVGAHDGTGTHHRARLEDGEGLNRRTLPNVDALAQYG